MSTFADLKDRAQNMALVEDDTLAGIFVNDVYRDLVVQGQLKCSNVTVPIVSAENKYTIKDDFGITDFGMGQYFVYTATNQLQGYVLDQTDIETVLQLSATLPTGYVRRYAFQGLDNVYFWPYPQSGTRYAATNLTVSNNVFSTTITGISQNAVNLSSVIPFGGSTYQFLTATPHGFSSSDTVFIGIPSSSNGYEFTTQNGFDALTGGLVIVSPTVFRVDLAGTPSTGAITNGGATTSPTVLQCFGIGAPGFTANVVVPSSLVSSGYTSLANGTYGTNGVWFYVPGGDTVTIYYAQEPTALTLGASEPSDVPTQWQHLISIGAAARLTDAVGEDITLSTALQNKYEILYASFVKWVKGRQGRGTQMMGSGYARSVGMPPHDRSTYPNYSARY
jgi:hypothetical protein